MPAKKRKNDPLNEQGGYINITLNDDERIMAAQWCDTPELLLQAVQQLMDTPFVLKVGIEPQNDCYACYISGHWRLNEFDRKWTLVGRGSTAEKAIRRALYIHFELLHQEWATAKQSQGQRKDWD
jgi:hypothetical protein